MLLVTGAVHGVTERNVPRRDAAPAQYSDAGKFVKAAVESRPAYTVQDVMILTDGGGFLTVSVKDEDYGKLFGGQPEPAPGARVEWRVNAAVRNIFVRSRWMTAIGYYFASDAASAASSGRRAAAAA